MSQTGGLNPAYLTYTCLIASQGFVYDTLALALSS